MIAPFQVHIATSLFLYCLCDRRELRNFKLCLYSVVGYWHNETVNIASHWGGAILVAIMAVFTHVFILHNHPTANWRDALGFYIFFASAIFCLMSSGAFHCLMSHSRVVAKQWQTMDYAGIVGTSGMGPIIAAALCLIFVVLH